MKRHIGVVSFLVLFVISACSLVNMPQESGTGGRPTMQSFQPSVSPSQPSLSPEAGDVVESPSAPEEPSGEQPGGKGDFVEADCACADYKPSEVAPWGNAGLICRYDWSGPNIDQNTLGFGIDVYYQNHIDKLMTDFQEKSDGLRTNMPSLVEDGSQGRALRNDDEGYAFLAYGPGGGGKQGDIPLCGNGRGVYLVAGEFLVETDLFTCDLPYSDNAYVSALTDMETCALRAIERIGK
jgi:hypothetical protein